MVGYSLEEKRKKKSNSFELQHGNLYIALKVVSLHIITSVSSVEIGALCDLPQIVLLCCCFFTDMRPHNLIRNISNCGLLLQVFT